MLGNKTVQLLPIDESDTTDIVRWRNNPNVLCNFQIQEELTPEAHKRWLDTRVRTGQVVQFVVVDCTDGKAVGSVFLKDIDRIAHRAEFGIFLGEDSARGKGIGTAACRLITDYGFQELGLHRIHLQVLPHNVGGIRCYEKCGYVLEGRLRDHAFVNGGYSDVLIMARLAED